MWIPQDRTDKDDGAPATRHPDHATTADRATVPDGPPPAAPESREAPDTRNAPGPTPGRAGVRFPAADVRALWADDPEGEIRYALVHLGVCCASVALMLAHLIRKGIGA